MHFFLVFVFVFESVDFGSVVADQIRNQRSKLRELEDECTLKDAKINQLHGHIENTKILHQKELDNQELGKKAYLSFQKTIFCFKTLFFFKNFLVKWREWGK